MKNLLKILLFIVLKIIEASAIIFIPYYAGFLFKFLPFFKNLTMIHNIFQIWLFGIWCLGAIFACLGISFFIIASINKWFKFNWKLVNKWINK